MSALKKRLHAQPQQARKRVRFEEDPVDPRPEPTPRAYQTHVSARDFREQDKDEDEDEDEVVFEEREVGVEDEEDEDEDEDEEGEEEEDVPVEYIDLGHDALTHCENDEGEDNTDSDNASESSDFDDDNDNPYRFTATGSSSGSGSGGRTGVSSDVTVADVTPETMASAANLFLLDGAWRGKVGGMGLPVSAVAASGFDDAYITHWLQSRAMCAAAETLTQTMAAVLGLALNAGVGEISVDTARVLGADLGPRVADPSFAAVRECGQTPEAAAWASRAGLASPTVYASHVLRPTQLKRLLGPRARAGLLSLALHTISPAAAQAFWLHNTVLRLQAIYAAHTQALRNAVAVVKVRVAKDAQAKDALEVMDLLYRFTGPRGVPWT